jgi:glutamate synthase (NADPH/NADH) small chain
VYILYRRTEQEMPARLEEVNNAKEEGIQFQFLVAPRRIEGDSRGRVRSIECAEITLGEPDATGRRRPVEKPGSVFTLAAETVVVAIGNTPNPLIAAATPGLSQNTRGGILTDGAAGRTSREKVYAGGDAVTGAATVILAMGAGKAAAQDILHIGRSMERSL